MRAKKLRLGELVYLASITYGSLNHDLILNQADSSIRIKNIDVKFAFGFLSYGFVEGLSNTMYAKHLTPIQPTVGPHKMLAFIFYDNELVTCSDSPNAMDRAP